VISLSFPEEDFFEFIDELRSETDSIIVVEGKKDRKALTFWEINLPIEILRTPLIEFVEKIIAKYDKKRKIILLLDADPEGRKYQKTLKREFTRFSVKVNTGYWLRIQRYHITCIEGLMSSTFKDLKRRYDLLKVE